MDQIDRALAQAGVATPRREGDRERAESLIRELVVTPAQERVDAINTRRNTDLEAAGGAYVGAIMRGGKVLARIATFGGTVSDTMIDQGLVDVARAIAKLGLYGRGPLDKRQIQKLLDAYSPGLTFVDLRSEVGFKARELFDAGQFYMKRDALVPTITRMLLNQIAATNAEAGQYFIKLTDDEIAAFDRSIQR
jgi:hypothetical protein